MRAVLLILACAAGLAAASATGFDGAAVSGDLTQTGAERIRIGGRELALADLDRLVLGGGEAPAAPAAEGGVLLVDGSWLPVSALAPAAGRDAIAATTAYGVLNLPLPAIAGWGTPEPPAAGGEGDALLLASGLLRGRLQGISDGKLRFLSALDPEPLALDLAAVTGARLAVQARRVAGPRLRAQPDPARPPLDLVLIDGVPALAAMPAVRLDPAALGGLALRVEGGRRAYLSDLPLAEARDEGLFGVVWPHRLDRAIAGGPIRVGGLRHAKGVAVHSVARLGWDLGGGYARLRALAGIDDAVAPEGDLVAVLEGDGRELWRARIRGGERPLPLDLDVTGVKRLTLRVEAGERHDIGDHLDLADAWLVRR